MKNILLLISIAFLGFTSSAQTFTIPHDTIEATVNTTMNMHNDITNTSASDIQVTWRVVYHDLPADWAASFAICDNNLCYYNINNSLLGGNSFTTGTIAPSTTANFYVLPDLTNATTTGTHLVQIRMTDGTDSKMSWYIINKFPTSVSVIKKSISSFLVYPNPTTNILNILSDGTLNASNIVIKDVTGKVITKQEINGLVATISLENYSPGLYTVHFIGNDNKVLGVSKFTKQ